MRPDVMPCKINLRKILKRKTDVSVYDDGERAGKLDPPSTYFISPEVPPVVSRTTSTEPSYFP